MAENSKIEWTHHTANLWHGCVKVHEGCDNCYAEKLAKRWGNDVWGVDKPRKEIKSVFDDLLRYQKLAAEAGEIHRVFVGSMMDIFEKPMPLIDSNLVGKGYSTDALRRSFFKNIDTRIYPNLMFLLLTKRPSNINKYVPNHWLFDPPKNVMFGCSVSNQKTYSDLMTQLLTVEGRRFLSIEPQTDAIDLGDGVGIDWIIQGGESGPHKRAFDLDWARVMQKQCRDKGIPYFFKQIDKVQPIPAELMVREFPDYEVDFWNIPVENGLCELCKNNTMVTKTEHDGVLCYDCCGETMNCFGCGAFAGGQDDYELSEIGHYCGNCQEQINDSENY